MEFRETLFVAALILSWIGVGCWAYRIGRSPIVWAVVAAIGSPFLAASLLAFIGATPEKKEAWLEEQRKLRLNEVREAKRRAKEEQSVQEDREFEDFAYAQAWDELNTGNVDSISISRATAEANGEREKIGSIYLKNRVRQLQNERKSMDLEAVDQESELDAVFDEVDVIDASGRTRRLRRDANGDYVLETISGTKRIFKSVDDAREYLRG